MQIKHPDKKQKTNPLTSSTHPHMLSTSSSKKTIIDARVPVKSFSRYTSETTKSSPPNTKFPTPPPKMSIINNIQYTNHLLPIDIIT
jgi:hypothetical protein